MNNQFYERGRANLAAELNQNNMSIHKTLPRNLSGIPMATELLKDYTKEKYDVCELQYTIYKENEEGIIVTTPSEIMDILNEDGKDIYNLVLKKVEEGIYKDVFTKYSILREHSGVWIANKDPEYEQYAKHLEGVNATLNSFRNIRITGLSESLQKVIDTSVCLFFNRSKIDDNENIIEDGWCLTRSGSLYKLKQEISRFEMNDLVTTYNGVSR